MVDDDKRKKRVFRQIISTDGNVIVTRHSTEDSVSKKILQQIKNNKNKPAPVPPQETLKRPSSEMSQEDAKEKAKSVLAAQQAKQAKLEENKSSGFKRSRKLQRSLKESEKTPQSLPSFQPFVSPNSGQSSGEEMSPGLGPEGRQLHRKSLYENFVSSKSTSQGDTSDGTPKKRGHTVYVRGQGISHELCDKTFKTFGNISNINLELEKSCAFITFDDPDSAERAIDDMDGKMVSGIRLHVSMARRQPNIHRFSSSEFLNSPDKSQWSNLAMGNLRGGKHKDKRDVQVYDDPFS